MARLADNKTMIKIDKLCIITIMFIGNDNIQHSAEVTFCVFPTTGNDMIIGLPAIVEFLSDLLKEMIDDAVADYIMSNKKESLNNIYFHDNNNHH